MSEKSNGAVQFADDELKNETELPEVSDTDATEKSDFEENAENGDGYPEYPKFEFPDFSKIFDFSSFFDFLKKDEGEEENHEEKIEEKETAAEVTEEIAAEVTEETAAEVTEEIAEEAPEETTEEITEEAPEETTEEITEEASEETTEEITKEDTEETTEEILEETAEEVTEEATEEIPAETPKEELSAPRKILKKSKEFLFLAYGKLREVIKNIKFSSDTLLWAVLGILAVLLVLSVVVLSMRLVDYAKVEERTVSLSSNMDKTLDVFSMEYENQSGEVTIKGAEGEKVLAPGAQVEYTMRIRNTDKVAIDYNLSPNIKFLSDIPLPIEVRLIGPDEEYIVGSAKEWVSLEELNSFSRAETLMAGETIEYIFQWRWPFEAGDDAYDTWLGTNVLDTDIGADLSFSVHATINTETELNGGAFGYQTPDVVYIIVFMVLVSAAIALMVVIVVRKIMDKRTKAVALGVDLEPIVEPTEETAIEPAEEPALEEVHDEVPQEPSEEMFLEDVPEGTLEEPTEEPIEDAEEHEEESLEEPIEEPIEEPMEEPMEEALAEPIEETAEEATEEADTKSDSKEDGYIGTYTASARRERVLKEVGIVNLGTLAAHFEAEEAVTLEALKEKGLVAQKTNYLKILGDTSHPLKKALTIETHSISAVAKRAVTEAGGEVIIRKGYDDEQK